MTKRQGLRAIAFLIVLTAVLLGCNACIGMPKNDNVILMTRRFKEMRTDPKDTWDGVVIGTSISDRSWAAPLAYQEYGMAVYPMGTDGQPFMLSVELLEEIRSYQDISFAAVELHGIRKVALKTNGSRIRWVTEHMRPSLRRLRAVKKALDYMDAWYPDAFDSSTMNRLSYYFPLLKFHKRLTSDQFYEGDFHTGETVMKGAYEAERHVAARNVTVTACDKVTEMDGQQAELLDELMDYAEETGLALVFYIAPSAFDVTASSQMNGAAQYVESRGYEVVNFLDPEVLAASGIDGTTDFIDKKHLNTSGAYKVTSYLADYLDAHLEIPDHRGDADYASWDTAVENYETFYEESLVAIEEWKAGQAGK